MKKSCSTCAWHDRFSWVCFNGLSEHRADFTDPEDNCRFWQKRNEHDNKTLEKLLMAKGLSRNQVNRMVKEQRDTGSKKVSNDLYYHVFMHDFDIITSSFGGEVLPYLNSFVLN